MQITEMTDDVVLVAYLITSGFVVYGTAVMHCSQWPVNTVR